MIQLIAAVARNGVIGKNGDLPWRLPSDLKHFKKSTKGFTVIMGRNTWDTLPLKPLPGRRNLIVTSRDGIATNHDVFAFPSLEMALTSVSQYDPFIIGGASLYREALETDIVDRMLLSEIDADFDGDTFFPEWDRSLFEEASREEVVDGDLNYAIVEYSRKNR